MAEISEEIPEEYRQKELEKIIDGHLRTNTVLKNSGYFCGPPNPYISRVWFKQTEDDNKPKEVITVHMRCHVIHVNLYYKEHHDAAVEVANAIKRIVDVQTNYKIEKIRILKNYSESD
jgi:hypothetical protein